MENNTNPWALLGLGLMACMTAVAIALIVTQPASATSAVAHATVASPTLAGAQQPTQNAPADAPAGGHTCGAGGGGCGCGGG